MKDKRALLLAKAIKDNNKILTAEMADNVYSSKDTAKSALMSLEAQGYIMKTAYCGKFIVIKTNNKVDNIINNLKNSDKKKEKLKSKYPDLF